MEIYAKALIVLAIVCVSSVHEVNSRPATRNYDHQLKAQLARILGKLQGKRGTTGMHALQQRAKLARELNDWDSNGNGLGNAEGDDWGDEHGVGAENEMGNGKGNGWNDADEGDDFGMGGNDGELGAGGAEEGNFGVGDEEEGYFEVGNDEFGPDGEGPSQGEGDGFTPDNGEGSEFGPDDEQVGPDEFGQGGDGDSIYDDVDDLINELHDHLSDYIYSLGDDIPADADPKELMAGRAEAAIDVLDLLEHVEASVEDVIISIVYDVIYSMYPMDAVQTDMPAKK